MLTNQLWYLFSGRESLSRCLRRRTRQRNESIGYFKSWIRLVVKNGVWVFTVNHLCRYFRRCFSHYLYYHRHWGIKYSVHNTRWLGVVLPLCRLAADCFVNFNDIMCNVPFLKQWHTSERKIVLQNIQALCVNFLKYNSPIMLSLGSLSSPCFLSQRTWHPPRHTTPLLFTSQPPWHTTSSLFGHRHPSTHHHHRYHNHFN